MTNSIDKCPWCGYLLYAPKYPMRCSECGMSLTEQIFSNLLPWEASEIDSSFWRFFATIIFVVGRPAQLLRKLQIRSENGVIRARILVFYIAISYPLAVFISSFLRLVVHRMIDAYQWGFSTKDFFAPSPIRYWTTKCFVEECLYWICLWFVASVIVWVAVKRHDGIHSYWSIVSVLGPIPLVGATAGCTIRFLEDFLSYGFMPVVPIFRWIGAAILLMMFTFYCYSIARMHRT